MALSDDGCNHLKIAVFDSGSGGLTIASEIWHSFKDRSCRTSLFYLADDLYFPYGELSSDVVTRRVEDFLFPCVNEIQPDVLVIACNTASTIVLPLIRSLLSIPVVGVVPAIKPAAAESDCRRIGLLATPATINRDYTEDLIASYASGVEVIKVGSTELVEFAENSLLGVPPDPALVSSILEPFFSDIPVDTIVLGCTHFPLLKAPLQNAVDSFNLPHPVKFIDSGEAVAKRVLFLLEDVLTNCEGSAEEREESFLLVFTSEQIEPHDWRRKCLSVLNIDNIEIRQL